MAGGLKRIKFHHEGFDELRKSAEVSAELEKRGHAIAQAAGGEPDFIVEVGQNKSRARVVVVTATAEAMQAEASHRALTNALTAGRG